MIGFCLKSANIKIKLILQRDFSSWQEAKLQLHHAAQHMVLRGLIVPVIFRHRASLHRPLVTGFAKFIWKSNCYLGTSVNLRGKKKKC